MNRLITFFCLAALIAISTAPSLQAQFPTQYGAYSVLADLDLTSAAANSMQRNNRISLGNTSAGYYIYSAVDANGDLRVFSVASNSTLPVELNSQLWAGISKESKALGHGFINGAYTYPYTAPFRTNGTQSGTVQLLSYPTSLGYMSSLCVGEVGSLTYMGTRVTRTTRSSDAYFYKTDGTAAGTVQLKKWSTSTYSIGVDGIRGIGNLCVFVAWSGNTAGLWASNGTSKGTVMIKSLSLTGYTTPVVCDGYYIFGASDANGAELWRSNGTAAGTTRVTDINTGAGSSSPNYLTVSGTKVYFTANDGSGNKLYAYTPSSNTVTSLSMNGASEPKWLTMFGGSLYFSAYQAATGRELWKYDPVANVSSLVKDIYTGTASGDPDYMEYTATGMMDMQSPYFEVLGDHMYFAAISESSSDYKLWRSDGTQTGTTEVPGFSATGATFPNTSTAAGGKLFFVARYSTYGNCLFVYDPAWTPPSPKQPASSAAPTEITLEQNYPNPFNPSTTISYSLPQESAVTLTVTDMLGREVARLVDGERRGAGTHRVGFDARELPSGMYLYRLETGGAAVVRKMVLMR